MWSTRYVTLCSNGVLQVYKGNNGKNDVEFEVNLNEFDLVADQDYVSSNFFIRNLGFAFFFKKNFEFFFVKFKKLKKNKS